MVNPSTAVPDKYFAKVWMNSATLNRMDTTPITVTSCKGNVLKEVALVTAYFIRLREDHLLLPYCLSCTS